MSLPTQINHFAHSGQSPAQRSSTSGAATPPGGGPSKPTYSKRGKITIVACVNCRKRKTKCDGQRPVCSQCRARDATQCHYDMNEEQRRLTYLRENVEQLHEEKTTLESLIHNLKISSEEEAIEILRRLRQSTDTQSLAQHVQMGRALTKVSRHGSEGSPSSLVGQAQLIESIAQANPGEVDEIKRRLHNEQDAGSILDTMQGGALLSPLTMSGAYSAPEQVFGLTRAGQRPSADPLQANRSFDLSSSGQGSNPPGKSSHWMDISRAAPHHQDILDHALKLYFSWQHCFFQSFPEALFMQDMNAKAQKYCSPMLVNAVCSAGCLLSPWPELAAGNQKPQEVSRITFDDAVKELSMLDSPDISTVACLVILSHIEGYRGRMHRAWDYCGRSARMALDLNLHLRNDRQGTDQVEAMARSHTFWGCFIADQLLSFTLGRIPQIPTTAITIELPAIDEADDQDSWEPFGDGAKIKTPGGRSTTFHEVASLSRILNSTLFLFFAPSQVLKGSLLLDEYSKYLAWYKRLPSIVQLNDEPTPHVLSLHMYYHAAVLLLFRPFLKAKFTQSAVLPSDVCRSSAANISHLFNQHRRMYDSVGIYTLQMHCLLAACTIHLINTPAIASTQFLINAAHHFNHLAKINGWAEECVAILKSLVQKWNIVLPMEAETALYQGSAESSESEPNRGKRSAFGPPSVPPTPQQKKPKLAAPRMLAQQSSSEHLNQSSTGSADPESADRRTSVASYYSAASDSAKGGTSSSLQREISHLSYLFAPFPNQPAPILAPTHSTNAMTFQRQYQAQQPMISEFDGLTFESGTGWFDPFMGFDTAGSIGEGEIPA